MTRFERFNGFELPQGTTANGFVTLSYCMSAATDPTDGAWKVRVKYGRLVENIAFSDPDVVQYGFGFAAPLAIQTA